MNFQPFSWSSPAEKKTVYEQTQSLNYQDFWDKEAQRITWEKPYTKVHDNNFAYSNWFIDAQLNVSTNCLDRHLISNPDKIAIIHEDEKGNITKLTYKQLHELTCNIATMLYNKNILAGDRVAIYMPLNPYAIASMLAVARIGAIHTVIFAGFAKDAIIDRIHDCQAKAIITYKNMSRRGNIINLQDTIYEALKDTRCKSVQTVLSLNQDIIFKKQTEYPHAIQNPPSFDAQHPLFILYTSGTTGKPKGIFHATGGYLVQVTSSTKWVFDLKDDDIYWCSADIGWITGHSYVVYGPLALGSTIFLYEGALNYPNQEQVYKLINKHKITVFYTSPTAIRSFMAFKQDELHKKFNLSSLRLLGSVGEPINPSAWQWYKETFGNNTCPVIDTWWQTETGSIMIAPILDSKQKPGFACLSLPGIKASIVNEQGNTCDKNESGFLVINQPWPSLARGIWNDQERFLNTYFGKAKNYYFTADGAFKDDDGDIHINGRIDDVINVSGHRLGSAEIESALVAHSHVAEAAVIGAIDELTGQKIVAFVSLNNNILPSIHLQEDLKNQVKQVIGSFAKPSEIIFLRNLPKTRSGKIMRRLLRDLANGKTNFTDTSTLEDPNFLSQLEEYSS